MNRTIAILLFSVVAPSASQSQDNPAKVAERYFEALADSDKDAIAKVVYEPSAARIGKSILASAPMFRRKGNSDFFEMIFDRVPSPAELAAMSPTQAFAEYVCDPLPDDPAYVTAREILGVVQENDRLAHVVYRVQGMPNLWREVRR